MVKPVSVKPQEPNNSISTPENTSTGTVAAVRTIARLVQSRFNVLGFLSAVDVRAFLSTDRTAKSTKPEAMPTHTQGLIDAMNAAILRLGQSDLSRSMLTDISQQVLGTDFIQKTAAQKTELFHRVLSHWEGVPSTREAVGLEARTLCDQLFPPSLDEAGHPIRQPDTLPATHQPRVRVYTSFPPFSEPVEVQTMVSIRAAVATTVHVLFG